MKKEIGEFKATYLNDGNALRYIRNMKEISKRDVDFIDSINISLSDRDIFYIVFKRLDDGKSVENLFGLTPSEKMAVENAQKEYLKYMEESIS